MPTPPDDDDDGTIIRHHHNEASQVVGEVDVTATQAGTIFAALNPNSFSDQPTRAKVVALQALFPAP